MLKDQLEFRATRTPAIFTDGIELRIINRNALAAAEPIVMKKAEKEGAFINPAITLRQEEAQNLYDELHVCGFRPSYTPGNTPETANQALKNHLEDMRTLVFGTKEP